jgi:hypothetical protein
MAARRYILVASLCSTIKRYDCTTGKSSRLWTGKNVWRANFSIDIAQYQMYVYLSICFLGNRGGRMEDIYEIKKGIPAPGSSDQPSLTKTLRQMEPMDSVVVPGDKLSSAHPCAAQLGMKIKTQKNADGTVTLWCISAVIGADPPRKPGRPRRNPDPPQKLPPAPKDSVAPITLPPNIVVTVANPALGLPAGYYANDDPYGSMLWIEGKPPELDVAAASPAYPATEPGPVATPKQSIFD